MKIVICGSRDWPTQANDQIRTRIQQLPPDSTVIAGGARGVDNLAASYARAEGLAVIEVPAQWEIHGRSAGYKRNIAMLDLQPDLVIAFWNGQSRGTAHTIQAAETRRIPVEIHNA